MLERNRNINISWDHRISVTGCIVLRLVKLLCCLMCWLQNARAEPVSQDVEMEDDGSEYFYEGNVVPFTDVM